MFGFLGDLLGGLGKGVQGLAGKNINNMPVPKPDLGAQLKAAGYAGGGGVPGSLRSSMTGMPGYQADALKYLQSQHAPVSAGLPQIGNQLTATPGPEVATQPTATGENAMTVPDLVQNSAYKAAGIPKIDSLKSMIADQVKTAKTAISPNYFDRMAQIESGYNPTAHSPTGATGLFQFTGNTWKQYGTGNPLDPVANTQAAIKLADANYSQLSNKLNRAPNNAELYMAHNIGAGGATRLLTADPNQTVTKALIGSEPSFNPKFLTNSGQPISARQAIQNYQQAFSGTV